MAAHDGVAAALAAAARTMSSTHGLEQTLHTVVKVAAEAVPGFADIGISMVNRQGQVKTRAANSDLAWELDALQYQLGEGPCIDSLRDELGVASAPHLKHDQRWPRYVPEAVRVGVQSHLAVKLYFDGDGTFGALNLHSTAHAEMDPDAGTVASLFAVHAAIALCSARKLETLSEAVQSRQVVGQAIGIVMERYDLDEDAAFNFLKRSSSHTNRKMRDIARDLVEERKRVTPVSKDSGTQPCPGDRQG